MGEARSGSSPRRIQERPPSWVIQISTVAGPLGPASSTAYWSLNRGLSTSRVFEPAACEEIAAASGAASAVAPLAGCATATAGAPAGTSSVPPSGDGPGLAAGSKSEPPLGPARPEPGAEAAIVDGPADGGWPGSRSHAGGEGRSRVFAPAGERGRAGAGGDGDGRLGGGSSSTGVKPWPAAILGWAGPVPEICSMFGGPPSSAALETASGADPMPSGR